MKKVALVFVLAVLVPSLLLAWLAVRSLRDQQFLLERQQSLLDQHITDALAQNLSDYLVQRQQEFSAQVESLAAASDAQTLATRFDDQLRRRWPLAEVGFCVTAAGKILSPLPNARPAAQMFRLDNSGFLGNREPVEVYLTANNANAYKDADANSMANSGRRPATQSSMMAAGANVSSMTPAPSIQGKEIELAATGKLDAPAAANNVVSRQAFAVGGSPAINYHGVQIDAPGRNGFYLAPAAQTPPSNSIQSFTSLPPSADSGAGKSNLSETMAGVAPADSIPPAPAAGETPSPPPVLKDDVAQTDAAAQPPSPDTLNYKSAQARKVSPQSQVYQTIEKSKDTGADDEQGNLSKVVPAEAEFRQLVGHQTDGMFARFLQNQLKLMCWHRLDAQPDLIFGAQLNLDRVVDGLRGLVQPDRSWGGEICVAVLDDNARPVVLSREGFRANWKRPFVATEVGDALPHWEVAAYLADPARLTQAAHTLTLTLGLLIAVLVVAIGVGSLLIVRGLGAELKLARQKTDFVSNVSHELKTPLTSIRMFSELLAEGRVADHAKQLSYLHIITAEAARLTRLINNVLDFSRLERGEKKYDFQPCDLTALARAAAETFRPHLAAGGVRFDCELPAAPQHVRGDADALAQVVMNLLSNAEKYSNGGKEITLHLAQKASPLPHVELRVLDRGPGVPRGSEEKIFEKFYRAHDSLSSGIQGSGLGLTIARQIARAHGGDVVYEPRAGGGSCFILRLPVQITEAS